MPHWQFDFYQSAGKRKISKSYVKKFIEFVFTKLDFNFSNIYLSVNVVGDHKMKDLNKRYRGINQVTDVLSFGDLQKKDIVYNGYGEIFICYNKILKGEKYHNRFFQEFKMLFLHGILHLLGFDHKQKRDMIKMQKVENEILRKGLIERNF
jgi:probable rRNA maturation factor